jgi:quercetin dioxygenase-like cupin family protein
MLRIVVAGALAAAGLYQGTGTEPVRTPVLQNATVAVTHMRFGPGTRETTHTHPFPLVLVQITAGEVEVKEQETSRRGSRAGEVWFVPAERPHSVTPRQSSGAAVDLLAIALLPTRVPAPAAPATDAPPGITRATLVDNNDVRVVRVRFDPSAREPVHTHPNDLLTVQIVGGSMEMSIGPEHTLVYHDPGFVQFVPRGMQHSYASADTKPFELLSLAIK